MHTPRICREFEGFLHNRTDFCSATEVKIFQENACTPLPRHDSIRGGEGRMQCSSASRTLTDTSTFRSLKASVRAKRSNNVSSPPSANSMPSVHQARSMTSPDRWRSSPRFERSSMPTARAPSKRTAHCPSVPPLSSSDCGSSWGSKRR